MGTIVQRERFIKIEVLEGEGVRVRVSGNQLEASPRMLQLHDELTINYEVLTNASAGVEAAIEGAMALEEK